MNHLYRVIFNKQTGVFCAVSELARSNGKANGVCGTLAKAVRLVLAPLAMAMALVGVAHAAPTDGQVVAGQANIAQIGAVTNINQASQNAVINWQDFGIKAHETVNFHQPSSEAVTLNRVIGNQRSVIDGAMNANGKVFIQNEHGTLIGKNAQINVGSLVATTAKISDDDFMKGNYRFDNAQGSIENLGHISVPQGGVVALIAPIVKNSGTIVAPQGKVLLASANSFSITLPDNANFSYTLDKGTLQGLVDNKGAIIADGGRIVLTALGADTVKKSLIKHTGLIQANTVRNVNGVIELVGDLDNSALDVSGSLKAEGKGDDKGGLIETSASTVKIDDNAQVSTQADNGKTGTWLIDPKDFVVAKTGGDLTGDEVSQRLNSTNIQLHTINSNDGSNTNGKGDIIINDEIKWNKNTLTLKAHNDIHINANLNGTGTAKLALEYGQATADGGNSDYHIKNGAKVNLPEGQNFTTKKGKDGDTVQFTVLHGFPNHNADYLFSSAHNIAIGKDIDLSSVAKDKNFKGYEFVESNVRIHGLGHNIDNLTISTADANVGLFRQLSQGGIRDIGLNNISIQNNGSNTGALAGTIHGNFTIKNVTANGKVQGQSHTGGLIGYAPNTNLVSTKFKGTIKGEHLVGGLGGIVNNVDGGAFVGEVSATGDNVGGIAGIAMGDIDNSLAGTIIKGQSAESNLVSVSGRNNVGGLVGSTADKAIRKSYATGRVIGQNNVGGLIGNDTDSGTAAVISESYFVGSVKGRNNVGGLGGYDIDNIDNSYVSGAITGENNVGGLVGDGLGYMNVNYSYFNGKINATGSKGNLFGKETYNYKYNHNYFNRELNEPIGKYGEGKTLAQMQQQSTYEGWDFENKWRIDNGKDTPRLREVVNIEEIGVSAVTPNHQAYLNNIPNKPSNVSDKKDPFLQPINNGADPFIMEKLDAFLDSRYKKAPESIVEIIDLVNKLPPAEYNKYIAKLGQNAHFREYMINVALELDLLSYKMQKMGYSKWINLSKINKGVKYFNTTTQILGSINTTYKTYKAVRDGDFNSGHAGDIAVDAYGWLPILAEKWGVAGSTTSTMGATIVIGAPLIATKLVELTSILQGNGSVSDSIKMYTESLNTSIATHHTKLNNLINEMANGTINRLTAESQFNIIKNQMLNDLNKIKSDFGSDSVSEAVKIAIIMQFTGNMGDASKLLDVVNNAIKATNATSFDDIENIAISKAVSDEMARQDKVKKLVLPSNGLQVS